MYNSAFIDAFPNILTRVCFGGFFSKLHTYIGLLCVFYLPQNCLDPFF